jgi:hypothetical protein
MKKPKPLNTSKYFYYTLRQNITNYYTWGGYYNNEQGMKITLNPSQLPAPSFSPNESILKKRWLLVLVFS